MFEFVDLHNHSLYGLDDGAESYEQMCRMIDLSYADGVRHICFTPHYLNAGKLDCKPDDMENVFGEAKSYCAEKFPDMRLSLGSEMAYHFDCDVALSEKKLFTIASSRYVLVDFFTTLDARSILLGVERLLNLGYIPVVAHVERYPCLWGKTEYIWRMVDSGALIQINAESVTDGVFSKHRRVVMSLLSCGLVDVVASDAHGPDLRPPILSSAAKIVSKKFGQDYAEQIFSVIPQKILSNQRLKKYQS